MQDRDYVHLKSLTYPKENDIFLTNIKSLQKIIPIYSKKSERVDIKNFQGNQRISFRTQELKWYFKKQFRNFRPNYEVVRNGKLFRIAFGSEKKYENQPKTKLVQVLKEAQQNAIETQKKQELQKELSAKNQKQDEKIETTSNQNNEKQSENQDYRDPGQTPMRFKREQNIRLNKCCSLILRKSIQVMNPSIFQRMKKIVDFYVYSPKEDTAKKILAKFVSNVFEEMKDKIVHQTQFKFNPDFVRAIQNENAAIIEDIIGCGIDLFAELAKDPSDFRLNEAIDMLNYIN